MRIFHNKTSNHVIIVTTNLAYSFYCYSNEDPIESAKRFLANDDSLVAIAIACEEIELPDTDEFPNLQIIENPTDSIGQIPKPTKKGQPKCEH